jgi:hypothetical protein
VQASLIPLLYRYIAIFTILSMARTSLASFMPSIYRYASILAISRMALQFPHLISPFPAIASKCDCSPISTNATIPPDSFYAILRQRSAKINASRLQYVIFLMRLVASDNISNKSRRFLSLNKARNHWQSIMLSIYYAVTLAQPRLY